MTTETGPAEISSRSARVAEWLCPGPAIRGIFDEPKPCLKPLPCTDHDVTDPYVGALLYGHSFLAPERTP